MSLLRKFTFMVSSSVRCKSRSKLHVICRDRNFRFSAPARARSYTCTRHSDVNSHRHSAHRRACSLDDVTGLKPAPQSDSGRCPTTRQRAGADGDNSAVRVCTSHARSGPHAASGPVRDTRASPVEARDPCYCAARRSDRLRFFTSFLGATATATFLTRDVTDGRLPWWRHTLLIGGFLGPLTHSRCD